MRILFLCVENAGRSQMAEAFARHPKGFEGLAPQSFDVVVGMGCGDACPVRPANKTVSWEIPDPKGREMEDVREIRNDIERKVRALLLELKA